MEQSGSRSHMSASVRRVRLYRALANIYPALIAMALVVLVFRWMFPWFFPVLIYVWATDIVVLILLAVPWLLVSWAFGSGRIRCPACAAPFTRGFHLWVPKACESCGCRITHPQTAAPSEHR